MKLYSFNFRTGMMDEYQKLVPSSKNKKIFRDFLFNHYELPSSFEEKGSTYEVIPLRMNDKEIERIDFLISKANTKGITLNRSSLLRNVYEQLIEQYKDNPILESKQWRQTFKVPVGTKQRLATFIEHGNRTYELASFIMDGYVPSNEFPSLRGVEQEGFDFKTDIEVFEKLDEIADEYNFKKGGRAKIFRDALIQFGQAMEDNSPKKAKLEKKLQEILEEYKTLENKDVIKEKVNDYLL